MRKKNVLAAVLLFVLVLSAFYTAIWNDFVAWDDPENLIQNIAYRGLSWTHLKWMFTTFHLGIYIPMTWVTYGFDYVIWGMNPLGYHLTNILFHAGNAVLVYFLALRLLKRGEGRAETRIWAAFVAAAFFGLHPLRVESVAWITERKDVLSAFFLLLSILFYLRGQRVGSWGMYLLSLLAKPMAVTMPALLLVIDLHQFATDQPKPLSWARFPWREKILEKIPYILIAVPIVITTLYGVKQHGLIAPVDSFDLAMRAAAMSHSLLFYIIKTLWPYPLTPIHALPELQTLHHWPFTGYIAVVVLITVLVLRLSRTRPGWALAWAWYGIALAPVSGLFQSGGQLIAERYSYIPGLSLAMLAGGLILRSERSTPLYRSCTRAGAIFLLGGCFILTVQQTAVWRDTLSFWTAVVKINPKSATAYNNIGASLAERGRVQESIDYFRMTLQIDPDHKGAQKNLRRALKLTQPATSAR